MRPGGAIAAHFEAQADACDRLGSPFTARLCRLLAGLLDESTATGRRVLAWSGDPRADALALRICGGLHRLVLDEADLGLAAVYPPNTADDATLAAAIASALCGHDEDLLRALESPPQTNEIARSAMLLPGFATIARETGLPLALCEIGASGGLNLLFDRFFYRYGNAREWGDPGSPVRIEPELRSSTLPLEGDLTIVSRHGCDIAPANVFEEAGRNRLRSYLWPDQAARRARLDGAIALAARHPFQLHQADALAFVKTSLADSPADAVYVLFHSIMWQYMPPHTQADILDALAAAGRHRPIGHLRMEPLQPADPHATLSLTMWPGGETRHLARCDYHGRWIEWIG